MDEPLADPMVHQPTQPTKVTIHGYYCHTLPFQIEAVFLKLVFRYSDYGYIRHSLIFYELCK
ncbi:hypothetical protein HMPREF0658_2226 [Hoylesella marshii DSM 16973 = JCM 13450]|uniref:Uncharacterized protein n=1 Tax=Hoylesella marshii DSM 16973 = JCM 13450 TaxID=862515 RepID=E0NVM1_9BACT|nr:hypothetical protein HMPREF0658_2226 [Hoylesella marshii DSM 16973 = JCM 13450]